MKHKVAHQGRSAYNSEKIEPGMAAPFPNDKAPIMRIEYQVSEQDFMDAQRLAIRNSPQRFVRWTRLVFPLFGLMLLLFVISTAQRQGLSGKMIPAFIICLFFLSMPLLNRLTQKKMYAKSTAMRGPLSAEVDEQGISFHGLTFSSQFDWSNFSCFFEDDNSFVLYRSERVFNLIPKRGLSPDQITTLREYFCLQDRRRSLIGSTLSPSPVCQPPALLLLREPDYELRFWDKEPLQCEHTAWTN